MSEQTDGSAEVDPADQRRAVRERYGSLAAADESCCDTSTSDSCCGDSATSAEGTHPEELGYDEADVEDVAAAADLSLGCGNPNAIADLDRGEAVLDLGSGGGFDCFLAAREVGDEGRVVGVDMTPEMVETARENAREHGHDNTEFRLGEIEHLPVGDERVDVVISNCVVNLSPDKPQVFAEAYRVLRPGGRLAISDVVKTAALPDDLRADPESVSACVAGASTVDRLEAMLTEAGFVDVEIAPKEESEEFIREWDESRDLSEYIVSATIEGRKPRAE